MKEKKSVTVDQSYPYEDLLMVCKDPAKALETAKNKDLEAPYGYRWISPAEAADLKREWASLLVELQFVDSQEQAEEIFAGMQKKDPAFFANHLYALKSLDDGHLACSVGLWPGDHFENGIRIHWMMTSPKDQKKGLARAVLKKAIAAYEAQKPADLLYLSTQAGSWPAILLYESLGFVPFEEASKHVDAAENQARWQRTRARVQEKEGVSL